MPETSDRGVVLVAIARESIGAQWGLAGEALKDAPWLARPAATFVTLRQAAALRGCIGSMDPRRSLGEDVAANARAAAFSDPRFAPLTVAEFPSVSIEVSVLSPRAPMAVLGEADAAARLRPGIDGVYLEYRGMGATFLPQVWESLPDPADFLAALRRKAHLPAAFWDSEIRLSRYTVEKFGDEHHCD